MSTLQTRLHSPDDVEVTCWGWWRDEKDCDWLFFPAGTPQSAMISDILVYFAGCVFKPRCMSVGSHKIWDFYDGAAE